MLDFFFLWKSNRTGFFCVFVHKRKVTPATPDHLTCATWQPNRTTTAPSTPPRCPSTPSSRTGPQWRWRQDDKSRGNLQRPIPTPPHCPKGTFSFRCWFGGIADDDVKRMKEATVPSCNAISFHEEACVQQCRPQRAVFNYLRKKRLKKICEIKEAEVLKFPSSL